MRFSEFPLSWSVVVSSRVSRMEDCVEEMSMMTLSTSVMSSRSKIRGVVRLLLLLVSTRRSGS